MVRKDSFQVFLFKSGFIVRESKIFLPLCSDWRCNLSASESDVTSAFTEQAFKMTHKRCQKTFADCFMKFNGTLAEAFRWCAFYIVIFLKNRLIHSWLRLLIIYTDVVFSFCG